MELSGINYLMTRGETIKEEKVKTITRNILPYTLVLENYEPFPGYYGGNLPPDIKPMSVFIALAKAYNPLQLGRVMKKISKERNHACDGTAATISTLHAHYDCIRIKNLECFADIAKIQEMFITHGIEFARIKKIDETVLISVKKTFFLEKFENLIYRDLVEESNYYFSVGEIADWDQFRELTMVVKQNIPNNLFDAALSYFWTIDGPEDMVRIYERRNSPERVNEIRDYYFKAFKRV